MAKAGWWIFKWLIIPLGLLAIGFFLIGPQIGKSNSKTVSATTDSTTPTTSDSGSTTDASQPAPTNDNATSSGDAAVATNHTPPLVTVTVKKGSSFRAGRYYADSTRRHSRHRKKKKSGDGTSSAPAAPAEIPMDNGDQGA